jgi:hypothetical protein
MLAMKDFKLQAFLDVAEELVRADEVEKALIFLKSYIPSYYRDNTPKQITDLRNEILSKVATPYFYMVSKFDDHIDPVNTSLMQYTLRGVLMAREVESANNRGIIPHIVDFGPGEYAIVLSLKNKGLKFTYKPIGLNNVAYEKAKPYLQWELDTKPSDYVIFMACEIIEHLWNEEEIKTTMLCYAGQATVVHISTPKYAFDYACTDWRSQRTELGHLRTYTPQEFCQKLSSMFPEYHLKFYDSQVMHMRLISKNTKYEVPSDFELKQEDFSVPKEAPAVFTHRGN